jgi:hypothetical protein
MSSFLECISVCRAVVRPNACHIDPTSALVPYRVDQSSGKPIVLLVFAKKKNIFLGLESKQEIQKGGARS